jgi:hypothetical protein
MFFDTNAINAIVNDQFERLWQYLQHVPKKEFVVKIEGIYYTVDYEIVCNKIELFVLNFQANPAQTRIRLNIGSFLLPESAICINRSKNSDNDQFSEQFQYYSTSELNLEICKKIVDYIKDRGFLNIIQEINN